MAFLEKLLEESLKKFHFISIPGETTGEIPMEIPREVSKPVLGRISSEILGRKNS